MAGYFSDDHDAREEIQHGRGGAHRAGRRVSDERGARGGVWRFDDRTSLRVCGVVVRITQRAVFAAGVQLFERARSISGDGTSVAAGRRGEAARRSDRFPARLDAQERFRHGAHFWNLRGESRCGTRDDFAVARDVYAAGGDGFVFSESGASRVVFL